MLSKEQILAVDDIKSEIVHVPEWGGDVLVRGLTGTERDEFEESLAKGKKVSIRNIRAKLVALGTIDEKFARMFSEGDVAALGAKSAAALDRVFNAIRRLSGLTSEDVAELEKNSGPTPA